MHNRHLDCTEIVSLVSGEADGPLTPGINLHEYQNKRLTKKAFRKSLILKGTPHGWFGGAGTEMAVAEKEKREQAPALQMWLSTTISIARDTGKSMETSVWDSLPVRGSSGTENRDCSGYWPPASAHALMP
jgi:hypothetical protein